MPLVVPFAVRYLKLPAPQQRGSQHFLPHKPSRWNTVVRWNVTLLWSVLTAPWSWLHASSRSLKAIPGSSVHMSAARRVGIRSCTAHTGSISGRILRCRWPVCAATWRRTQPPASTDPVRAHPALPSAHRACYTSLAARRLHRTIARG